MPSATSAASRRRRYQDAAASGQAADAAGVPDSGGRPVRGARSYLRVGLPGAVLAELALRDSVVIEEAAGQAVAALVYQGGRSST
jgi:hypothetical protein